jgi:peptidoglycan/xylan/chitin deacetylase (PgdA/CDA1 family)/glycosyltransferase involved in cell wall biosynthesis
MTHQGPSTPLTVVLPAFGPDRVIARAVESISGESELDFELIVVHDPGDGATRRRVDNLLRGKPARYVAAYATTPGGIRNAGAAAASGLYVAVVDGAEALDTEYVRLARAALDESPQHGFVVAPGELAAGLDRPERLVDLPFLLSSPWATSAVPIVRRTAIEQAGGFDESLPGLVEWDLLLTLSERGWSGELLAARALRYTQDDVRLREALRTDRYLPAIRRVFAKHAASFERHASRVLSDREAIARRLWESQGRELAERRERLSRELSDVLGELNAVRDELRAAGALRSEWSDLRRVTPRSRNWGLERGRPIDRHYIESFLAEHASDVRGSVLEMLDPALTTKYGEGRVERSDVLDIDPGNHRATIIADLRVPNRLPADTYDCFILTQTLHLIDDIQAAIAQAHRTLKPGGVLLATLPTLSMVAEEYGANGDHWRVTEAGARRLFEHVFGPGAVHTRARGNVLTATAFLYGLACDELELHELEADDPAYPMVITVRAVKAVGAPSLRSPARPRGSLILLYHQVTSRPHDVHGMAFDRDVFRRHLEHLRREWQPVRLSALASMAVDGELPEGAVALTFDDGYLDNLEHAAPLLAEFEMPATFFFNAEALERPHRFWWDCLEHALLHAETPVESITLRIGGEPHTLLMASAKERRAAHDRLYPVFKTSLPAVRDDLLRQLEAVSASEREPGGLRTASRAMRPMTVGEIRSLGAAPGIDIGAHGVHHVSLPGLSSDDLQREVFESRTALERVTGRVVDLFAYPFGDLSPEAVDMVRAAD